MSYLPWINGDERLVRYSLRLSHPDGSITEEPFTASDEEEAAIQGCEQLLRDWPELGSTTEDVNDRVEVLGHR